MRKTCLIGPVSKDPLPLPTQAHGRTTHEPMRMATSSISNLQTHRKFKDTAVLISRPFLQTPRRGPESEPPCAFRFHYHMFGQHVFRLAVYMRTRNSGRGNLLWVRFGDQGNFWHRKTLLISSAHHFQVSFDQNYEDWSVRVYWCPCVLNHLINWLLKL